jgi:hypothetical protein
MTTTTPDAPTKARSTLVRPIAVAILAAAAVNVVIFFAFSAAGATYENTVLPAPVGVTNVLMMTIAPMLIGMLVVALASRRSPRLLTIGQWAGAALALATITMTVAGGFPTLAFISLALMHVVVAVAVFTGLGASRR